MTKLSFGIAFFTDLLVNPNNSCIPNFSIIHDGIDGTLIVERDIKAGEEVQA